VYSSADEVEITVKNVEVSSRAISNRTEPRLICKFRLLGIAIITHPLEDLSSSNPFEAEDL